MNKKILFIVGSFREKSFHKGIAENVKKLIGNRADVEILDYRNVPLYNQDIEATGNEFVTQVRGEAIKADGIWIFSPEYNGKIPGVLKNLLDWLSRSLDPSDSRGASAVHKKKVTITAAAGAPKAEKVRKELTELLPFMRMELVGGVGTGLTLTMKAWETGEFEMSEEEKIEIEKQIDEFLAAL